jgi:exopolyphosphatase/pppGpp-phosphohydrolase
MKTIEIQNGKAYIEEIYFEGRAVRAGVFSAMIEKDEYCHIASEAWRASKGPLDHIAASRERASALIRLANRLVQEGPLNKDDAERIVRTMEVGWHCPDHPLVYLKGQHDWCYECVEEAEVEEIQRALRRFLFF